MVREDKRSRRSVGKAGEQPDYASLKKLMGEDNES